MADIIIENIVAYAMISDQLDIQDLSQKIPEGSYNPSEYNGLSLKYEEPKIAVIILASGKMIITGARSLDELNNTASKVVERVKKLGYKLNWDYQVNIENVVASQDLKTKMHLSSIANGLLLKNVDYQPQYFPGLIYRLEDPYAVMLLFESGKLVCTGVSNIEDAKASIEKMKEKLTSIGVL